MRDNRYVSVIATAIIILLSSYELQAQTEYRIIIYRNGVHADTMSYVFVPNSSIKRSDKFKIEKLSKRKLRRHSVVEPRWYLTPKKIDKQLLDEYITLMENVTDTLVTLDDAYDCAYKQDWLRRDSSEIYFDINGNLPPLYVIKKFQDGKEIWDYRYSTSIIWQLPSRERFIEWHELLQVGIGRDSKDYYLNREFGDFSHERVILQYLRNCR